MKRTFEETRSPNTWKGRRGVNKFMKDVHEDEEIFKEREVKSIRSMRSMQEPTPEVSGWVCTVEWMQREGCPEFEPTKIQYETVRKYAPEALVDYFSKRIVITKKR